ncbi:MAG: hypothetical protein KTR18_09810 [Acidiferrobacterales bacterium]|nr:hypothetical protein [Acidiferrobacterales bacterium]
MSSPLRIALGVLLLLGGALWVLPILGLWMIPLGLLVLSFDFPWARRGYLNIIVWMRKRRAQRKQRKLEKKAEKEKNKIDS